ncbi:MAG: winged helix-turn-helix transcriptional regulator [Candidatus Lokiarchaeota archaeon]|nr:winged helix-turn-helix transcriptional regulator [Candidatus Lokiarchaeota archaeon]
MVESDSGPLSKSNVEKLMENIKEKTEVVKTLNSLIRIRILILLWAYKEQSINELCEKLGKSWPTVNKHLNIMQKKGLLELREVKSPGPQDKKLFSAREDLIKYTRLGFEFLEELDPDRILKILLQDVISDEKTLELIQKIFDDLIPYHEELVRKLKDIEPTRDNLKDFYKRAHVNYYVETLDEEEFEYYHKRYKEFLEDMEQYKKKRKSESGAERKEKPYAALHLILPLKKIQEARFKRFWNT